MHQTPNGIIQLLSPKGPPATAIASAIDAAFVDQPGLRVDTAPKALPAAHLPVVLVFVLDAYRDATC